MKYRRALLNISFFAIFSGILLLGILIPLIIWKMFYPESSYLKSIPWVLVGFGPALIISVFFYKLRPTQNHPASLETQEINLLQGKLELQKLTGPHEETKTEFNPDRNKNGWDEGEDALYV